MFLRRRKSQSSSTRSHPLSKTIFGADVFPRLCRRRDESSAQQKALQTLVAGQQSENLLDMDEPGETARTAQVAPHDFGLAGLSMTASSPTAQAQPVALQQSGQTLQDQQNPLDDLLGLFDSSNTSGKLSQNKAVDSAPRAAGGDNLIDGFF